MAQLVDPIVGRAGELESLEAALGELDRGRPVALEFKGEPGIGKTRLLAELSRRADGAGLPGARRRRVRARGRAAVLVFVDALDDYVRGLPPAALASLDELELARVLPPPGAVAPAPALPDERHRAHHAVRELLGVLAARQPLVLALDDLHWGRLGVVGAARRAAAPATGGRC